MSAATTIEWTDSTWNPVTGCSKISAGCDRCYAENIATRFRGTPAFPNGFDVTLRPHRINEPLGWRKPKRIFVNSMSDLFHHQIPERFVGDVWNTMAIADWHQFQILTKRPSRARKILNGWADAGWYWRGTDMGWCGPLTGPLPNVWVGASVEDQRHAEVRIPHLRATPAAVRFLSCEPLVAPIDPLDFDLDGIDLVIVGGESGPGARPMNLDWVRDIRDACANTGTSLFVKQMGSAWARANGLAGKGGDPETWPEDLRIRQMPGEAS